MQPIERCLYRVYALSSRVESATLNQVIEHLLATLDCVSTQATLNLRNLVVILVADGAVGDFAGTA